jgi:chromosome segregation ATPase
VRFFSKGAKMSGETVDLPELQRQKAKHEAALAEAQAKIDAIEAEARARREEEERKRAELASLEKKLATCGNIILWYRRKIDDLKAVGQAQINLACEGAQEMGVNVRSTLAEIHEWETALHAFAEFESSLPARIKELADSL